MTADLDSVHRSGNISGPDECTTTRRPYPKTVLLGDTVLMDRPHSTPDRQLIYLASPYSDLSYALMRERFERVCMVASRLMCEGHKVFSPIAHTHPIAVAGGLPKGWEFWQEYDRAVLSCCHEVWVLQLPGWDTSRGIAAELDIASELGIPVRFLSAEGGLL